MFMAPVMDELKSRPTFVEHARAEVQEIANEESAKEVDIEKDEENAKEKVQEVSSKESANKEDKEKDDGSLAVPNPLLSQLNDDLLKHMASKEN